MRDHPLRIMHRSFDVFYGVVKCLIRFYILVFSFTVISNPNPSDSFSVFVSPLTLVMISLVSGFDGGGGGGGGGEGST